MAGRTRVGVTRTGPPLGGRLLGAMDEAVGAVGELLAGTLKQTIETGPKSGKVYRRGGRVHQASAAGESPATDMAQLVNACVSEPDGRLARKIALPEYALFLEGGTSRMEPRPFIDPSIGRTEEHVESIVGRALARAGI